MLICEMERMNTQIKVTRARNLPIAVALAFMLLYIGG
jgi:hypothetical protein